ncbi:MAG: non-ribosomal peptide synthetase [Nitrosospira sp.]|nr:non-ribosomal peptide synthetase [Nitrosospira sp.]
MCRTTHKGLPQPARIGLNAAFTFDMSMKGCLQLLSGHCMVIIPHEVRANGTALMDFIQAERIDALDSTPSQLEGLLAAGLTTRTGHRPTNVLLGGEALGAVAWQTLRRSSIRFFNMYGPTECTVDATLCCVNDSEECPHIGQPIGNTRVYVLDGQGEPVPLGVSGEIHIAGDGLARGYLNRPQLSAERFVRDRFDGSPEARMYKTGDLGRWLPDGNLEYLGRNDFQVKIRGFRIELGEIETQLLRCPGVSEAVVVAREDSPGEKRLVAYVVAGAEAEPTALELREALSRQLTDYMLPSAYVLLEALPLTPNGKLDRRALPVPGQEAVISRAYEAPQGEVEEVIAGIWQELLGLERVGRHDHFFELGGNSLMAIKMISRIKQELGVVVQVQSMFQYNTVKTLSRFITAQDACHDDTNIQRARVEYDTELEI